MLKYLPRNLYLLALIFCISCSTNFSGNFHYTSSSKPIIKGQAKYYIAKVNIDVLENSAKREFVNHPGKEELRYIFINMLQKQLQKKGIYSDNPSDPNSFALTLKIEKYRRFGVRHSKTAYSTFAMTYEVDISKDNKIIASKIRKKEKVHRDIFADNISNIKIILASKGPSNELEDIEIAIKDLVNDLADLGEN